MPEFYLISFTMNIHPQYCLQVRHETNYSQSYLCEAHHQSRRQEYWQKGTLEGPLWEWGIQATPRTAITLEVEWGD